MRFVALMVLAGCGRIGFDAIASSEMVDCDRWGPFGAPVLLAAAVQSPSDDWGAAPSGDGLELVFYSFRQGGAGDADIYDSVRASVRDPWPAASPIASVETATRDAEPSLTGDRLALIFATDDPTTHVAIATRASIADDFGAPSPLAGVSGGDLQLEPFITADGLRLIYRSETGTNGMLLEATRPTPADSFVIVGPPVPPTDGDRDPTISSDGLELFFISDTRGGVGGADLFTARRAAVDQPFGAVTPVAELESPGDEETPRLTADGSQLYLNYDSFTIGGENADMMVATRACLD